MSKTDITITEYLERTFKRLTVIKHITNFPLYFKINSTMVKKKEKEGKKDDHNFS